MSHAGIILAGGFGTRLRPHTETTNKHLLPVAGRPMLAWTIEGLAQAGITDVCVVCGGHHADAVEDWVHARRPTAERIGIRSLETARQPGAGGIADALARARGFAAGRPVAVLLGDNLFERSIAPLAGDPDRARVLLSRVSAADASSFGIASFNQDRITRIDEKPGHTASNLAVTGAYAYPPEAFELIETLSPSTRGELEITDLNNALIERGLLDAHEQPGWWQDAGTHEGLGRATSLINDHGAFDDAPRLQDT